VRHNAADDRILKFVRRANLDAIWARAKKTVSANLSESLETIKLGEELGIVMLGPPGPWPLTVDHGMRAAISFLDKSLKPGLHEAQVKFATARKTRAVFSNNWMRSPVGVAGASFWPSDAKRLVSANLPTDSKWCSRFIKGAKIRMGERLKQDLAISIGVIRPSRSKKTRRDLIYCQTEPCCHRRSVANHKAGVSRWNRCQLARSEPLARIDRSRHSLIECRL
jgi:hypothetical protein